MNVVKDQNEGTLPAGDTLRLALFAWSMVHGIAKLAITAAIGPEPRF